MIKKQTLAVLVLMCASFMGFGQILTFEFSALAGNEVSAVSNFNNANLSSSTITRGAGLTASANGGRFNATNWALTSIATAVTGNDYMEFTITPYANYQFSVTSIAINLQRSDTGPSAVALRSSVDGYSSNLDAIKPIVDNTSTQTFTFTFTQSYSTSAVTYRFYMYAEATGGSGGIGDGSGNDIIVNGSVISTDDVDWCNLQFPTTTQTITHFGNFDVYAQVLETGVTEAVGQGAGIEAWIGYNTTNNDPELNDASWTWIPANYNVDGGNNDEYHAEIGSSLPTGTYYYASRFRLNGGPFVYGGTGGIWNNDSVQLIVEPDQVNFCNVQYPKSFGITTGSYFEVYAQALEPGVTDSAGQGSGIQAWIGYNTIGINHQPWDPSGWTWTEATYNPSCLDCNGGQNDEYYAEIGCGLPAGTYYYASRFQLSGSDYSYGGIQSDGVGNFWDATYNNGTLTITDPPLADVVITEIMYNSSGTDDEWIEICNVSGSTQDISNYTIVITGGSPSGTVFTFPCNTTITDGTCITIALGNNGAAPFNPDCPFTQDYGSPSITDVLVNSSRTITLYAANGSTIADVVTYDNSDGANGNGSSLHVIDATQDNLDTGTNWAEVAYGGTSGANTLLPNCLPAGVEINVEGNLGNFPDIMNGDPSPIGTDNTLFAAQFVGASQSKSYRIQSLLSTDVIITNITITGHTTDFSVTSAPASPVPYLTPSILEITFSPTVPGTRTAVVHIFNNDADESEYTFTIQGDGKCLGVINSISPSSGPEGTIVTVSASGIDLNSATASFNGVPATTVNYISTTDELEVTVPNGATDGNLELLDGLGCNGIIAFDVIDTKISSCGGSGSLSDLIMSEITDATTGGVTYIEIYNGTGSAVSLNGYSIEIFSNGGTSSNSLPLDNVMLANEDIYIVAIGVASSPDTTDPGANTCPITGGNGELAHQTSTIGGINKIDYQHDMIRLVNSGSTVDEFGVYQDNDWMDSTIVTGNRGFNFRRLNTASPLPNPTFNINDWNVIDWVGSGLASCSTNDYSDIGVFDFSTGIPPSVDSGPTITSNCNSATISVTGAEGSDPAGLTYQWYTLAPGDSGWTLLIDDAIYDNVTSATLDILDASMLEGYQYYCQIREDDANCYTASDAVQLTLPTTTWNGSSWDNGAPGINTIAIIDGGYDTGITGGFEACSLIINTGSELNVRDNTYIKIQNNAVVDGTIIVQTHGSFVQVDDDGTFTLNSGGIARVIKETALIKKWYEYTYWSSPVDNQTIQNAFPDTPSTRRFWYNAQNYLDSTREVGNNNTTIAGQDDIDDNGDDWQIATGASIMTKGLGYAATSSQLGMFPKTDQATFEGEFHTGDVLVDIYRNDNQLADNNWNLLGNPYPSAIDADLFLTSNSVIDNSVDENSPGGITDGAIFFWSQDSSPSKNNNGNENVNFAQSDYAIINTFTQTAGGDGETPNRFIPSGQGFFISYANGAPGTLLPGNIYEGTVTFNNAMRMADGTSNSQFFRTSGSSSSKKLPNKLWINLTSDNGVFNQIAVGYVENATDNYDGMGYDTPRNLSSELFSSIYTSISGETKKFAIQGKDPNSLDLDEMIPLGFDTSIDVATLYALSVEKVEGDFLSSNPIYLKDNLMNIVHNLSESDYSFTSEVGEFKDRFEIVFRSETLSDTEAVLNKNKLTIIELNDDRVQMKTNSTLSIKSVQILDILGRTLYQLKGSGPSEIYTLSNLSQSTYIAKVELSNGQVITKRAIKRY